MAQYPGTPPTQLHQDIDGKLQTLETALAAAAQAVSELRFALPQIDAMAQVIGDIEATMTRVRPQVTEAAPPSAPPPPTPSYGSEPSTSPWLRPLAKDEAAYTPLTPETPPSEEKDTGFFATPAYDQDNEDDTGSNGSATVSHCLRVDVTTKGSSLDLKAVDNAVNDTAEVVDVALLDYDGRRASLKVWINEASDATSVRNALLEGLQQRFEDEADVEVKFEEKPAA